MDWLISRKAFVDNVIESHSMRCNSQGRVALFKFEKELKAGVFFSEAMAKEYNCFLQCEFFKWHGLTKDFRSKEANKQMALVIDNVLKGKSKEAASSPVQNTLTICGEAESDILQFLECALLIFDPVKSELMFVVHL